MTALEHSANPYAITTAYDAVGELEVLSFEGREAMNGLYAFEIVAWGRYLDEAEVSAAMLGRLATLAMRLGAGSARSVHGVVSHVGFAAPLEAGRQVVRLTIVPRLWLLTKRVNSRIFQDVSVREIVTILFAEHSIVADWSLLATYPVRQYCVQYQESDYDFIVRILAEEGIFFSFEQPSSAEDGAACERVILGDSVHWYPAIADDDELVYRPQHGPGALHVADNHVLAFEAHSHVESSAVAMGDYDFRRPLLDLKSGAANPDAPIALEVYEHHGDYEETDTDSDGAKVYLEQLRAGARRLSGRSACRRLLPGHTFRLADHEMDALNTRYVVTHVSHKGRASTAADDSSLIYENELQCVPATVVVRPPRPARVIRQVSESAIVVGPAGQEIFTDSHGRVKVQFHWDREGKKDEHSSCWMRVMQPWAGTGWGFQFIPRIGMEVIVTFLGGDQDRPVVTGCLNNATHAPPYLLPGARTRSGIRTNSSPGGGGANEIAFEDQAGNEQFYLRAERDLDEVVGRDRTAQIHGNRTESVDGVATSLVRCSRVDTTIMDCTVSVGGTRSATIGGGEVTKILGSRAAEVGASDALRVTADSDLQVGGHRVERIGKTDDLYVQGDRSTMVQGGATHVVWDHARTILHGGASATVSKGLAVGVGSTAKPASMDLQASGELNLRSRDLMNISSDKTIRLRVGSTLITIGPDEVRIDADAITFAGKSLLAQGGGAVLSLAGDADLGGGTVKVHAKGGGTLQLDADGQLDGALVKLKPGLAAEAKLAAARREQAKDLETLKLHLFDRQGKSISDALYEVKFAGYLDEGTAADGTVEIPSFPDVEKAHVRWGRPKPLRERPDDPETYEFEMDVYLLVEEPDQNVSTRRKLHNLGYQGRELYEAVQKMQADLQVERTGSVDDVRAEVEMRHAAAQPVEVDVKKGVV